MDKPTAAPDRTAPALDALMAVTRDLFCHLDDTGTIRRAGDAWRHLLGHAPAALAGRALATLVHRDDHPILRRGLSRSPAAGAAMELRVAAADGRYHWTRWQVSVDSATGHRYAAGHLLSRGDHGEGGRFPGDQIIRETSPLLDTVLAISSAGYWTWDLTRDEMHFGPEWRRQLQIEDRDVPGDPRAYQELVHADQRFAVVHQMAQLKEGRADRLTWECRIRTGEGYYRYNLTRARVVTRNAHGRPLRIVGVDIDVSEQKVALDTLRNNEEKFRSLFNYAEDMIITIDRSRRIQLINHLPDGGDPADMAGRMILDLVPVRHQVNASRVLDHVFATGTPAGFEMEREIPGGSVTHAWTVSPHLKKGVAYGATIISRDITRRKQYEQNLQRERDLAQTYLDVTQTMIVLVQDDGTVGLINRKGLDLLGFSGREAVIGLPWVDGFVPSDQRQSASRVLSEALHGRGEGAPRFEGEILCSNGRRRLISWQYSPIHDGDGSVSGLLLSGQDITEQRLAETALKQARRNLAEAQRLAQLGSWHVDMPGRHCYWSAELFRICGIERNGRRFTMEDLVRRTHPRDRDGFQAALDRLRQEGTPFEIEHRIVRDDGAERIVQTHGGCRRNEAGGIVQIFGSTQDVTEMHGTMARLERSEEQNRAMLDAVPDLLLRLDRAGINQALSRAEDVRGTGNEMVGKSLYEIIPEPVCSAMMTQLAQVLDQREVVETEYRLPEETPRYVEARMAPCGENEVLLMLRDITDRTLAEADRQSMAEELMRSNAELESYAYLASHDMKAPLREIGGFVELLKDDLGGELSEERTLFMQHIENGVHRLQAMLDDLLVYSRVGNDHPDPDPVDLAAAVDVARSSLASAIEESGATITVGELPTIAGTPSQFELLFQNLIGNAIKYRGTAAPRIAVAARESDGGWELSVSDNGMGIEEAYRERIFKLFQRLHTQDEIAGTGLGLAICERIVRRHGGRIWVESTPGDGSTFHIFLPHLT